MTILSIGLVIVPGGFAEGQAQQDDQNEVPLPVQPARIVPGDDLEMTDSAEQDCAVTIVDSPGTILEPVDLGPVTVEGWSAGDIQVVGELDLEKVRIEYRKDRDHLDTCFVHVPHRVDPAGVRAIHWVRSHRWCREMQAASEPGWLVLPNGMEHRPRYSHL
ncbi:hypothetical protein M1O57_03585 [Dehalococcoidia bacterium]|nr:hypothetical protein [Dehalococcoidia bacterium]MCL0104656.1 hypothetical protein [Dehalococcoidia bacterium]